MELRFADDEGNNESERGLRLSEEIQNGNSLNLSEKQNNQGGAERNNPWDRIEPLEPIVVSTIAAKPGTSEYQGSKSNRNDIILKISQIIMYVLFIAVIASMAWISTQPLSLIYINTQRIQGLLTLCWLVVIVDVILVNVLYDRKISLLLIVFFLAFLYPKKRNEHVNGSGGMGTVISLAYLIAMLVMFGCLYKGISFYGGILKADDATRVAAVAVMDQMSENGQSVGDIITDNMYIAQAAVQEQGGKKIVVFSGEGQIYMQDGVFVQSTQKNIDTQIAFVKNINSNEYEIAAVLLNGTALTQFGAASYWHVLQEY